jgi:hypothetical protein
MSEYRKERIKAAKQGMFVMTGKFPCGRSYVKFWGR